MTISGIYAIQRKNSDECYIGSAVSIAARWARHRTNLRLGKHPSKHLQAVWAKHGEAVLDFVILERVIDKALLLEREQIWLDTLSPVYNTAKVAGSSLGLRRSPETRARMSAAQKARAPRTQETRAKMASAMRGNTYGTGGRGKKVSAATRAKISAANKGRKQTKEHVAARVSKQIGVKRGPYTPEHCAALSAGKATARLRRLGSDITG